MPIDLLSFGRLLTVPISKRASCPHCTTSTRPGFYKPGNWIGLRVREFGIELESDISGNDVQVEI
jgi:hypothetical protein